MKYDDLEKLNALREKGAITEEEYNREKEKILNEPDSPTYSRPSTMDTNTYCMFMHLSQLSGYVIPFAGFIVPILLWVSGKERDWKIDKHGRIVMNWMISSLIYFFIAAILMVLLIGIPIMVVLGICSVIFIIIGAIKANDGIFWPYPLSIEFFKIDVEPKN